MSIERGKETSVGKFAEGIMFGGEYVQGEILGSRCSLCDWPLTSRKHGELS